MMDDDRCHVIKEGAEYLFGIPSDWKHKDFFDKKKMPKDTDKNYMVFLKGLTAYVNGEKRDTCPKSSSNSEEQLIEDWLDKEKTEGDVDCDVCPAVIEDEDTEGVDLNMRLIDSVEEEEECDPDLQVFLQNLKPRGSAYVLEISVGNITDRRIYEVEDQNVDEFEQPDEPRRKVFKSKSSSRIAQLEHRKKIIMKELKDLENEMKSISPTYRAKNTKFAKRISRYSSNTNRKRKASVKEKNEALIPRRSSRKVARKSLVEDSSSDESQDEEILPQRLVVPRNLPKILEPLNESPPQKHSKGKKEKERFQAPLPKYCDKTYLEFVRGLKMVGDSPVYADENGNKFVYEECTSDSDDSDVEILASNPSKKRLQSSESNSLTLEPSKKRRELSVVIDLNSEYRRKLMDILSKPYDKKEHSDLLKVARDRKPVMHHRDMRSQNCSYPDEVLVAQSYLDRYRALAAEIEAFRHDEPHKVLHHLRGLSFFLQNVCMEGSFMPWNDKSWIEAVRKSTEDLSSAG